MTGTIVNTVAVLAGGTLGLLVKKGISERIQTAVTLMLGLSTCIIGLNGVITTMISTGAGGTLTSSGELLLLCSLALGTALGELLGIEDRLERVGNRIEHKIGSAGFSKAFVSASLLFCVGAMTIIGSVNDGLLGDSRVLFIKSTLDFIAALIMASTLGVGVPCAALTVLVYQGALTLGAGGLSGLLTGPLLGQICMVGYAIVICIGINFSGVVRIKTANLLPALLVPPVWMLISGLWS